jgi:hypothetical protein
MRGLNRNKRRFYYALYQEKEQYIDEWGNATSEYAVGYTKPVKYSANISSEKNADTVAIFGTDFRYDRVIFVADKKFPVDENSVLWVDTMPLLDRNGDTDTPWDYVVKRVARSINGVNIAIAKVIVSHGENNNA